MLAQPLGGTPLMQIIPVGVEEANSDSLDAMLLEGPCEFVAEFLGEVERRLYAAICLDTLRNLKA
jgi:hypothetical protein